MHHRFKKAEEILQSVRRSWRYFVVKEPRLASMDVC